MPIKSPYNFVPLSDKVVFPDWADQVSHDIPFKDGISGKIDLEVTLQSDTYIRNGGKWDDNEKKDNDSDCQKFFTAKVNGEEKYIIPGTSFKGMIRNVVEIASFGKMQRVNDDRYSIRNLREPLYTGRLTEKKEGVVYAKSEAGWLVQKGEEWHIIPCSFARIEQETLGREFGIKREISVEKYNHYKGSLDIWFEPTGAKNHKHSRGLLMNYEKIERIYPQKTSPKQVKGRLVFTGQPTPRDRSKTGRKHMEFIFYNEDKGSYIDVTDLKKDFEFIHSDSNEKPNKEWGYWKEKLEKGEKVPVFYLADGDAFSFGLAMMFRLPYDFSVDDTIKHTSEKHSSGSPDLSDLMFGYVNGDKGALRGRVQFSHLVSEKAEESNLIKPILGSPKASYYPNYLVQGNLKEDGYRTFMDENAEIRGWKRYPAEKKQRIDYNPKLPTDKSGKVNEDVATKFIPLKEGAVFKGSLRFFNLKPEELGALIWALTFGGNKNCQHKIGMGKPLGFGRISIDLKCGDIDCGKMVCDFEEYMSENVAGWKESEQIKELIAMADVNICLPPNLQGYPSLEKIDPHTQKKINEFVQYEDKNNPQKLEPYSKNAK